MHVCTDLLCVVCIELLSAEVSTVNTGLGKPMFWKPLCLLSTPKGLASKTINLHKLLKFSTQKRHVFSLEKLSYGMKFSK